MAREKRTKPPTYERWQASNKELRGDLGVDGMVRLMYERYQESNKKLQRHVDDEEVVSKTIERDPSRARARDENGAIQIGRVYLVYERYQDRTEDTLRPGRPISFAKNEMVRGHLQNVPEMTRHRRDDPDNERAKHDYEDGV